jgi:hypothetical protein
VRRRLYDSVALIVLDWIVSSMAFKFRDYVIELSKPLADFYYGGIC